MHLSDHDLRQLDEASLERFSEAQARALLGKAVADLKRARERLGQHPGNSSRPPSSRSPWESSTGEDAASEEDAPVPATDEVATHTQDGANADETGDEASSEAAPKQRRQRADGDNAERKRPGRRQGAPGHGCTQASPIDVEQAHTPTCCAVCAAALDASHETRAHNARYEIDLVQPGVNGNGLVLQQTKHT